MRQRLPIWFNGATAFVSLTGVALCLSAFEAECPILAKAFFRKDGKAPTHACLRTLLLCLAVAGPISAQQPAQSPSPAPVVLDRVVAVVNNQAILDSDIDDEIRLSVLDPGGVGLGVLTRARALEQLVARALLQQQIRQEDLQSAEPAQAEVDARLTEIRRQLPACVRSHCATEEGWKRFLAIHSLTQERVEAYLHYRLQILRFIEQRFEPGIRVEPEQIEKYYRETLLPQYAPGEMIPPLDDVAPRIEEILLERQVNVLFDDWLRNLRRQGNVEVLDPALEAPETPDGAPRKSPHRRLRAGPFQMIS